MVVLTVIEDEFDAVRAVLAAHHEVGASSVFAPTPPEGAKPSLPFVLARCANRSNIPAQSSASRLVEDWRPEIVVLVGIAGGVTRAKKSGDGIEWRGPAPGDILVADYVHYAEFTKHVPAGTQLRFFPLDQPTSALVQAHADAVRSPGYGVNPWHDKVAAERPGGGGPEVHVGEIIAVEGVAGDPLNAHQKDYLKRFDHATAVDMESAGVARAVHEARTDVHYNPRWMCIRAISDRVYAATSDEEAEALPVEENNEEREKWKSYAAAAAGAFTRRILERLLAGPRMPSPADDGADAYGPWE